MDLKTTSPATLAPTIPGTPFEGGFYAGRLRIGLDEFALIVAPKYAGESSNRIAWGDYGQDIPEARSYCDGAANTTAMAAAGSALACWTKGLQINGYVDWYLPSRDELELMYRHLKPSTETNYAYRNGDNPSSLPAGYPYTEDKPSQTIAIAFQADGIEAFEESWYWSSTQGSAHDAWFQYFDVGGQGTSGKSCEGRARAVRRFKLNP